MFIMNMERNMMEQEKSEYFVKKIIKEHICAETKKTGINPVLLSVYAAVHTI